MNEDWKNDPKLQGMDRTKLDMLQQLASQGIGKSPTDLLPFVLSAASKGRKAGMNFSSEEVSTIIEVLKSGKSPAETAKIDRMISMLRMMR